MPGSYTAGEDKCGAASPSSSDSDDLPPLIIERERKVTYDEPEESYRRLAKKVKKYRRRLQAGNEDTDGLSSNSSTNVDSSPASFHQDYARDDNNGKPSHEYLMEHFVESERMRAWPGAGEGSDGSVVVISSEEDEQPEPGTRPARLSASLDTSAPGQHKRKRKCFSPVESAPLATSSPVADSVTGLTRRKRPAPVESVPLATSSPAMSAPASYNVTEGSKRRRNCSSPVEFGPIATSSPVVFGPIATSSPVVSGPMATSSPVVSGPMATSSPVVSRPMATFSPVVSVPMATSTPVVSGPTATSTPVVSAPASDIASGPSKPKRRRSR